MMRLWVCTLFAGLLLSLGACNASKKAIVPAANNSFNLLSAEFESWHSGRREAGSGTDHHFLLVVTTERPLIFNRVWIRNGGQSLPLTVARTRGPLTNNPVTFSKGDTILLVATSFTSQGEPAVVAAPIPYEGAALIGFQLEGKNRYASVPLLTQKEGPARPQ